jgi:hypothetical protein
MGGSASRTTLQSAPCEASHWAENHGYSQDRSAERAALMYTLIQTAKLNNVDPQAWLADVLARIADTTQTQLAELLPWKWRPELLRNKAA